MTLQQSCPAISPARALSEPGGSPQAAAGSRRVTWSFKPDPDDVADIVSRMRDVEVYECLAFGGEPDHDRIWSYVEHSAMAATVTYRNRPTFVFGFMATRVPGVFTLWGFGTDDTTRVITALTKLGLRSTHKLFSKFGARRLAVHVPTHPICHDTIRWLKRTGFRAESLSHFATVDDETVLTLAFTKEDFKSMCENPLNWFDKPKTPRPVVKATAAPVAAPTKTDKDVQKNTEEERLRRAFSSSGLPSLVLTSGLGDNSTFASRGVVLGGG